MARPIEDTPVLSRREWKKFEAQLDENRNKRATPEELEEALRNYEFIASLMVENKPDIKNRHDNEPENS